MFHGTVRQALQSLAGILLSSRHQSFIQRSHSLRILRRLTSKHFEINLKL